MRSATNKYKPVYENISKNGPNVGNGIGLSLKYFVKTKAFITPRVLSICRQTKFDCMRFYFNQRFQSKLKCLILQKWPNEIKRSILRWLITLYMGKRGVFFTFHSMSMPKMNGSEIASAKIRHCRRILLNYTYFIGVRRRSLETKTDTTMKQKWKWFYP